MGILKIITADTEGPQYYEDRYPEHKDWGNAEFLICLSDCGEIWHIDEWQEYDESIDDDIEGWRAERFINPICKDKKNIWLMQLGCRSTFEYTKMYSTKTEVKQALENVPNWQALLFGIEQCEARPLEFGGRMYYPPDYK